MFQLSPADVEAAAAKRNLTHHTCTAISAFVGVFYETFVGPLLAYYPLILPLTSSTNLT